ncbi:MAG: TonB-dependent receptor [Bacteroidetes bacterium]|nr:TonB-dependent receptor [Bacteroidota bacterium]
MKYLYLVSLLFFFLLLSQSTLAQGTKIEGIVIDKSTKELLIGASVVIEGTTTGSISDLNGKYSIICDSTQKKVNLVVTYLGYKSTKISGIETKNKSTTIVYIEMEVAGEEIATVEVSAEANKSSTMYLVNLLQNSISMSTALGQDAIKKSPDKNVGEALKRLSGVSVVENRYVVVRGLIDRYNYAMLNNMPLSSSEPDRKAFSFDLLPSSLIDNVIVSKTASPEMPGEFAGGLIQVNTRDVNNENFIQVSGSVGGNTQTTFQSAVQYAGSKKNWLGYDNGDRNLPEDFPDALSYKKLSLTNQALQSKRINNDWLLETKDKVPLNQSFQIATSLSFNLFKNKGGILLSGFRTLNNRMIIAEERNDFDLQGKLFSFTDTIYQQQHNSGLLSGITYKIRTHGKLSVKLLLGGNATERNLMREGISYTASRLERANSNEYVITNFASGLLQYEQEIKPLNAKLTLGYSVTNLYRSIPNLRKMLFTTSDLIDTTTYFAQVPFGSSNPALAGKFFSTLNDITNTYKVDYSMPLNLKNKNQLIKAGYLQIDRERSFGARVLGYVLGNPLNYNLTLLPQDSLFLAENIDAKKFRLVDITNDIAQYKATSANNAGYLMLDNTIFKSITLRYGVRYEKKSQTLCTTVNQKDSVATTTFKNWLPSVNVIINTSAKTKIRLAYSNTVARPEFRELAPFAFYDFIEVSSVRGNSNLKSTTIYNYDLRFDFYPTNGQFVSASLFYKNFISPIEVVYDNSSGGGSRIFTYANLTSAECYGIEFETRIKLASQGFLENSKFFNNLFLVSNMTFLQSNLDLSSIPNSYESERALQGQSPYVINAGLDYRTTKSGLGITILYNKIGRRVIVTGSDNFPDIMQAPRELVDISISKTISKFGEIRFTLSDILNQPDTYYQDVDKSKTFIAENDNLMRKFIYGSGGSLQLTLRW